MSTASGRHIAQILGRYRVHADPGSLLIDSIQRYISLLLQWNRSFSLTTVTDPDEIVRFHFGESLFAVSALSITSGRLADVGSGAGFPGLPLRMACPTLDLTLIESNAKKATFLAEVVRRLELDRVNVFRGRMEDFPEDRATAFDFVTARALGQFEHLLGWSKARLDPDGRVCLWLGEADAATISKHAGWGWSEPIGIPGSERRFVLAGSPEI